MPAFFTFRRCLWCLVVVFAVGCDDDEWKTVELDIVSLAATDSSAQGQSLAVQFGYFATGEDQFSSHSWERVDPATLRLRVFHRFRESDPAIGAPASLTSSTVPLDSPPAQAFRILAGQTSLRVQGGVDPRPADRLTVVLTANDLPLEGANLRVVQVNSGGESELVPLPPTDAEGIARVMDACPGANSRFWIESADGRFLVWGTARWPSSCDEPLRLAITGRELELPSHP